MKTRMWTLLGLLPGVLLAPVARAQEPAPDVHRITAYVHSGASIFLSDYRTMGGIGGGVGVRDTLNDRFILQADVKYLLALGNAVELRVGAGVQRQGIWTPAALVTVSAMTGNGMRFLNSTRSTPVPATTLAVGLQLAPVRFTYAGTQVSLLELGAGLGSEWPGRGVNLHVTLLQAGTSF